MKEWIMYQARYGSRFGEHEFDSQAINFAVPLKSLFL
jgi:hypothetical protein